MRTDNTELYTTMPVGKAVVSLAIPTVISQLITVIYYLVDTFFIGQLNDPDKVAAATLSMPAFIFLIGIANLFGIGGASLVSRYLGRGYRDKAKRCAAFSIWASIIVSLLYGIVVVIFRPAILPFLGTNAETYDYCYQYIFWTIVIGAVPTVLNAVLAHLVRSEGSSKQASFGVALGGILNIILDPIFIFVFKLGVEGAAIATMLSNCAAMAYFFILLYRNRGHTVITPHLRYVTLTRDIAVEVVKVGLPSFIMNMMSVFSNTVLNKLAASYSNEAIAGMGIAKKIDMPAFAIATGMTQGVLSLIGYNYAAKNYERMRRTVITAIRYSLVIATIGTVFLFFCAAPIARFFIDDAETVAYGQRFLRIICLTCPTISITLMVITVFQATGQKKHPLFLSLLRKGGLDVPFMFLLDHFSGVDGIAWAAPIADVLSLAFAMLLFIPYWKRMKKRDCAGSAITVA